MFGWTNIMCSVPQSLCEGWTLVHPHVTTLQCVWEQAYGGTQEYTPTHTYIKTFPGNHNVLMTSSVPSTRRV